jgi:hypothetical protein
MSNSIGTGFSVSANGRSGFTTGGLVGPIPGVTIPIYFDNNNKSLGLSLGGGLKGRMPQQTIDSEHSDNFARERFTLRTAWNTSSVSGSSNKTRIVTPFRAVNNAGDILCRQNYSCGGSCQTPQSRPGLNGLRQHFGSTGIGCRADIFWTALQVNSSIPSSTCNTKFVYDGSDYIKFKRNQAVNRNYNDLSNGGNDSSAQQSSYRAIRRY